MDSLGRFFLVKKHNEFQYIYKKGKSIHLRGMILFCLQEKNTFQVGFTASKKVGNAVMRNRLKRRMRALFYENSTLLQEGRYILVAKKDLNTIQYHDLDASFKKAVKKLGMLVL